MSILLKLKSGETKEIKDLTQLELIEQLKFCKIKRQQKRSDKEELRIKLINNREIIESLSRENNKIEESISKINESIKKLDDIKYCLNKHVNNAQLKFEQVWQNLENEQFSENNIHLNV